MRLVLETTSGVHEIAISTTHEPFSELREKARSSKPKRIICDREARHWMEIHALAAGDWGVMQHPAIEGEGVSRDSFHGALLIVTDAVIEDYLAGPNPALATFSDDDLHRELQVRWT